MRRIAIAGIPRSGKSTLAADLSTIWTLPVRHTDDLIATHDWSAASEMVARWFDEPTGWIIEGVTVSRALRKWRRYHPDQRPPVDIVYFLAHPTVMELSREQSALALGVQTIHGEILDWLREHRVEGYVAGHVL